MSAALLGRNYDIHGGGMDLVFPHHENAIAQSESLFGKTPANCWMHNGLVFIEGEKMSKSLGNVLNLHELLERYQPEALRLFLLSKQYRRPIEFSHAALTQACGALRRLQKLLSFRHRVSETGGEACFCRSSLWSVFCTAMDQDFNIPLALSHVFAAIRSLNRNPSLARPPADGATLDAGSHLASELCFICKDILGLVNETEGDDLSAE
jgi:cysteinyl-tRNA synthetase